MYTSTRRLLKLTAPLFSSSTKSQTPTLTYKFFPFFLSLFRAPLCLSLAIFRLLYYFFLFLYLFQLPDFSGTRCAKLLPRPVTARARLIVFCSTFPVASFPMRSSRPPPPPTTTTAPFLYVPDEKLLVFPMVSSLHCLYRRLTFAGRPDRSEWLSLCTLWLHRASCNLIEFTLIDSGRCNFNKVKCDNETVVFFFRLFVRGRVRYT